MNKYYRTAIFLFFCMMPVFIGHAEPKNRLKTAIDATPANPHASSEAKAVLSYIAGLTDDTIAGVISGQNCYHGDEITNGHELDGFNKLVGKLQQQTGKWVGIIGVDYEFMSVYSPAQLRAANKVLIDYWGKGGLITVNWSPRNPWVDDESRTGRQTTTFNSPGNPMDFSSVDLRDLINPEKPVYKVWRKKLDRIAAALAELQKAGVVVLWRPLEEMNGSWYWWGMKTTPGDPRPIIDVYRDLFRYFTETKRLNNLLWVYSPGSSGGLGASSPIVKPVTWAYPGDQYVDIVAGTYYDDTLHVVDYEAYLTFGKPLALGEYGPRQGGPLEKNGTLDTRQYVWRLKNDYPAVAYWVSWHAYPGLCWALITNKYYKELLNDPAIITRDNLSWKGRPASIQQADMITLHAADAELHTNARLKYEAGTGGGTIGWWTKTNEEIHWTLAVSRSGTYEVTALTACETNYAGSAVQVKIGNQTFAFTVPESGSWDIVRDTVIDSVTLKKGTYAVVVKALAIKKQFVGNLRSFRFTRLP